MRVLVTGGAGFIGSHLTEALLGQDHEVCVIDDLSTGRRENIKHLLRDERLTFVHETILNQPVMAKLISKSDLVFHLAAAVGVKYIVENPLKSIQVNVRGTEIVLEEADRNGTKVVLASTSEVYGKNGSAVFPENADSVLGATTINRWSYACTKALDEFLALAYCRERSLPVVIIRFFNICGPRQTGRYGMVIPRFVQQAVAGHPITVYGDGEQTRSFTDVSDAIKGILALAFHPDAVGEVFNLGNPDGITIRGLAEKIKAMTNSASEIVFIPYNQAYGEGFEDMRYRVPDITKIHQLTGFYPKIQLEEILSRVIGHMQKTAPAAIQ